MEKFPLRVQVETTTVCNANCIMCPHDRITRHKGHMNFSLYKKIVDECVEYSKYLGSFLPFLNGELFLASDWQVYLAYARKKLPNVEICIFTNGSLLNKENIQLILDILPDRLNISFDGTSKSIFESIRRNLIYENIEQNIVNFIHARKERKSRKPLVNISIIKMKNTEVKINAFYERWSSIVDSVTIDNFVNWAGEINNNEETSNAKVKDYRKPCMRLWNHLVVLNTGEVAVCCLDYNGEVILGDLRHQSINEIWNGTKLKEIRNIHLERDFDKISLCKNCSYGISQDTPFWWRL